MSEFFKNGDLVCGSGYEFNPDGSHLKLGIVIDNSYGSTQFCVLESKEKSLIGRFFTVNNSVSRLELVSSDTGYKYLIVLKDKSAVPVTEEDFESKCKKYISKEVEFINMIGYGRNYNKSDANFKKSAIDAIDGNRYKAESMVYVKDVGIVNINKTYKCVECGNYFLEDSDEINFIENSDNHICNDCVGCGNYNRCVDCGDVFYYSNLVYVNDVGYVCDDCREGSDYGYCSNCNEWYADDEMFYNDEDEEYLCRRCYNNIDSRYINDYHHTRNLSFVKLGNEYTEKYFGIELEIGRGGMNGKMAKFAIDKLNDYLECKTDSSIRDGFEMVTNPMTYDYIMSIRDNWEEILRKASSLGFESNAEYNCGMHIHVSRKALKSFAIDRLVQIFEAFWDDLLDFSGRESGQLEWCERYWSSRDGKKIKKKILKRISTSDGDRYRAVNLTNSATVEFRIFNGTLDINTFYANIQLIERLVDIANNMSEEDYLNLTWRNIVSGDSSYSDLVSFGSNFINSNSDTKISEHFDEEEPVTEKYRSYGFRGASKLANVLTEIPNFYNLVENNEYVLNSFPEGTRVRISENINCLPEEVNGVFITSEMRMLGGSWFTITRKSEVLGGCDIQPNYIYKIDDNTHCHYTIGMFDDFMLPQETIVHTIPYSYNSCNIPFGYGDSMANQEFRLNTCVINDSGEIPSYRRNFLSYNNFMFKECAFLNLALNSGITFDEFKWLENQQHQPQSDSLSYTLRSSDLFSF